MKKATMTIGHVNLATSMNGTGENFIRLVEALDRHGVRQHVLVANAALSRRVAIYGNVSVGPVVKSAIMAYCLMPDVSVAHIHDSRSDQAGLLLALTRSIPYVLTRRATEPVGKSPIARSTIRRAATVICTSPAAADSLRQFDAATPIDLIADLSHDGAAGGIDDNHVAAEHLRIYRRAADSLRIPALLI